jgi:hypothetical protein
MQVLTFVASAITTFDTVRKQHVKGGNTVHPAEFKLSHGHNLLLGASSPDFDEFTPEVTPEAALTNEEKYDKYLTHLDENMEFAHAAWKGLYKGLYSTEKKHQAPEPTDECFGSWIVSHMEEIHEFKHDLGTDFYHMGIKEYEHAWYNVGDLMFRNEDECHFRSVMADVHAYCEKATIEDKGIEYPACEMTALLTNMQKNMFNLIT